MAGEGRGLRRWTTLALGRMDSAPSDAAAFLTRNAVDALPQGGLERKLEEAAASEGAESIRPNASVVHRRRPRPSPAIVRGRRPPSPAA